MAAFASGTLRDSSMRQTRDLKYYKDFKLRLSQLLQRGGLTCRNPWTFSTFCVKLSTKSGREHTPEQVLALIAQSFTRLY